MGGEIRAFIAIHLSPEITEELGDLQASLKRSNADCKWVKPDSIHLTLKFLGNIAPERIEEIKNTLDNIAIHHKPFELSLSNIGGFPRLESPRVIWAGIDKGCLETEAIARDLEGELAKRGFQKEERSFSAHLTLGRVRTPKNRKALIENIKALDFKPSASATVNKILLFRSTLTPQGSIYTVIHEAGFG